ncbi:Uncharacterized oxidoreductase YvrD [Geodia barretti]|uniref:3-oxoacyl-[acyl-carrier-protein] reductase n=1 Tax=Geodia barretti TaxID=519541 RepID=A0AA35SLP3_GEOBA|nr:Uncharacterized oxidoreductase YvrD [Geodia barretti]
MDLGLAERVAIVGGAGLEIGKHVAMALASEGARVSICARNEEGLRRTEMEVVRVGTQHNVLAMPADLSEPKDIRRVVRDTFNRFGQIDILVVRTGQPNRGSLADVDDSEVTEEIERHLLSAVRLSREVIPYMKQEHWGRIINLELASTKDVAEGNIRVRSRYPSIVLVNAHCSDSHYEPEPEGSSTFRPGDWVLIDLWAREATPDSVYADITWTPYVGERAPELQ